MNKKKVILVILTTTFVVFMATTLIFFNCFNEIGNYAERGEPDRGHLAGDIASWYNLYVYQDLNTIVTDKKYGEFVIMKNGEFFYYPGEYNVFDYQEKKVYSYQGYWYKPYSEVRFTVTRTKLRESPFKLRFKDLEYFSSFNYVNSETYSFNDNLMIRGTEFKVLDNELTVGSKEKLKLDDNIIKEFLKQK